ncbi:MAG: hypothetical protein PHC93_04585 [Candidatus Omnitrophica bacterium]|nr:hypothetical protein [Candidatus Omnitrophota bacterium]
MKYIINPADEARTAKIKDLFKAFKNICNPSETHKEFVKSVEKYFKKNKDLSDSQLNYLEYIIENYKPKCNNN